MPLLPAVQCCDSITCSDGYTLVDNAYKVMCEDNKCDEDQCCKPVCSHYTCPSNCTPKDDSGSIKCGGSGCNTDTCCHYGEGYSRAQLYHV